MNIVKNQIVLKLKTALEIFLVLFKKLIQILSFIDNSQYKMISMYDHSIKLFLLVNSK